MKALHFLGPRKLEWREVPQPSIQGPHEALVRPLAVAACDLDLEMVAGRSPFPPPFILGHEFAGEIVEIGDEVSGFRIGEQVAVSFQPSCGSCPYCRLGHTAACGVLPGTPMYGIGAAGGDWGGALSELVRVPYAAAMMVPLPAGVTPEMAAGASDNVADGYRTVAYALAERPGATVLIAGSGCIPLYAAWWAQVLGAHQVTLCSRDPELLSRAAALGITVEPVSVWPRRFKTHTVTVDCTGDPEGLAAVIRSTEAYGHCTSASIYFRGDVAVPMFDMNMKGIRFETGRVNGAALLATVLALVGRYGLTMQTVGATETTWDDMDQALINGDFRPIASV